LSGQFASVPDPTLTKRSAARIAATQFPWTAMFLFYEKHLCETPRRPSQPHLGITAHRLRTSALCRNCSYAIKSAATIFNTSAGFILLIKFCLISLGGTVTEEEWPQFKHLYYKN
jgi:hypothetical protein